MPKLKNPDLMLECCRHGLVRHVADSKGSPRCRKCHSEAVVARRKLHKERLVQLAGGRCVVCGYSRYYGAMHFHHLDPTGKAFNVSDRDKGLPRKLEEAKKCVLLCATCHCEVEAGIITIPEIRR